MTALVEIAGVEDILFLATNQFKAKSQELALLSAEQLCNGDQKEFHFKTSYFEGMIGFAVIETIDDEVIVNRAQELLMELENDKEAQGLAVRFLAVVNIVLLRSTLLLCGPAEMSLARAAFQNKDSVMLNATTISTSSSAATTILVTSPPTPPPLSFPSISSDYLSAFAMNTDVASGGGGGVDYSETDLEVDSIATDSSSCSFSTSSSSSSSSKDSTRSNGSNGNNGNMTFLMSLGGLVSRKNDFIPAITKAIKLGWIPPPASLPSMSRPSSSANLALSSPSPVAVTVTSASTSASASDVALTSVSALALDVLAK